METIKMDKVLHPEFQKLLEQNKYHGEVTLVFTNGFMKHGKMVQGFMNKQNGKAFNNYNVMVLELNDN